MPGPLGPQTIRYIYDDQQIILALDQSGLVTNRYLWGSNTDQILADEQVGSGVVWPLTDHIGSVRDLIDTDGTVLSHINYDSYGQLVARSDPQRDSPFRIHGQAV